MMPFAYDTTCQNDLYKCDMSVTQSGEYSTGYIETMDVLQPLGMSYVSLNVSRMHDLFVIPSMYSYNVSQLAKNATNSFTVSATFGSINGIASSMQTTVQLPAYITTTRSSPKTTKCLRNKQGKCVPKTTHHTKPHRKG